MTPWELRGYLTYPNHFGKPQPGTEQELNFCKGWAKAQAEQMQNQKSDYHMSLENDALYGRETYAVAYWDEKNYEF